MKRLLALPLALFLVLITTASVLAIETVNDETIELRGKVLTSRINKWREPNLTSMFLLSDVAHRRSRSALYKYLDTGVLEFKHYLYTVQTELDDAGVCWQNVGEAVGYTTKNMDGWNPSEIGDYLTNLWYESDSHHTLLSATRYNRGGGSWVKHDDPNIYFFAYYVLDQC